MSSRIVSVFAATGIQGNAVVDYLLADGTFTPRAITRNIEGEAAQELKARGVEVVKGDPLDKASLVSALRGSEAVFAVTVPMMPVEVNGEIQTEVTQGKNIAEAAKEVGVKFIVFTSLPSLSKLSGGKYTKCFQYDSKAAIEELIQASGVPYAFLHLGAFLENYWKFGLLKKTPTGFDVAVQNQTPKDIQAFTWVGRDVPAATIALFKHFFQGDTSVASKTYPVITEATSYADLAKRTGNALGVEVTFTTAPPTGMVFMDEMYAAQAEYSGLYTATPVPNPALVALGVKFGTIEGFLESEVKARFGAN